MTSEGPHHPGQQPDEVTPGAGGSAPYGDRPAQQENGYGPAAPDLGWAPPPPATRPNSPTPTWSAPGEAPPTVGWQAPGEAQPGWGPPPGQQPQQWGAPPQPAPWNPQAEQQQPTAAWATAAAPQYTGQGSGDAPQPGGAPQGWAPQGEAAPQNWPGQAAPQQSWPAPGEQPPANPPAQPTPWGPQGDQQPAGWGPQNEQPAGWAPQGDQQQPGDWGRAAGPQPGEPAPVARGAASVRPPSDPQPGAWGAAGTQQPSGQQPSPWGPAEQQQPGAWGAAAVPQQTEPQQASWDTPGNPAQPAEPPAPPARATASVGRAEAPAWGAAGAGRPGEDAIPARPMVPEGEPWSADEAWGKASSDPAPAEPANAGWEPPHAENPSAYQPAPAPGISPANAVPLPPQEPRVPGASLAASPPADYAPSTPFAPPAADQQSPYGDQAGRDGGYGAPADGWGGESAQGSAPAIPQPRTASDPAGAEAGTSVSASAAVPMSSRVTPSGDQGLDPAAMPAPQPRVYGRPARPDGPDADGPGGHPEPPRFGQDGEAGGRFDGAPDSRFGDGQDPRFGGGPGDRFDNGPGRFDNGPGPRFDERDQSGFGDAPATAQSAPPVPQPALPTFPPGVPTFTDPVVNQRPVNGTKPHSEPAPAGHPNGGPAAPVSPAAMGGHDPHAGAPDATRGFPPAFPSPGDQPERPLWELGDQQPQDDQGRFDAFKPETTENKPAEQPPKVRNGRVLAAVLTAAVLILVVPLGLLWGLGKLGGSGDSAFNPAVGSCVKQSGDSAVAADCGEQGAFKIVSRVDSPDKCTDVNQPRVELPGSSATRVLCLGPATEG